MTRRPRMVPVDAPEHGHGLIGDDAAMDAAVRGDDERRAIDVALDRRHRAVTLPVEDTSPMMVRSELMLESPEGWPRPGATGARLEGGEAENGVAMG